MVTRCRFASIWREDLERNVVPVELSFRQLKPADPVAELALEGG